MSTNERVLSTVADWTDEEFRLAFGFDREPEQDPSTRHYAIGIPICVTVTDDGRVTFDVDLSEVSDIDEDDDAFGRYGTQVAVDALTVSAAASRLDNHYQFNA